MNAAGLHVIIDARMIQNSGIGVYLEGLLEGLGELYPDDPDLEHRLHLTLLGRQDLFAKKLPSAMSESAERLAFSAPVYGISEQLEAPGRIRAAGRSWSAGSRGRSSGGRPIAFWPHYNYPVLWRGPLVVTVHDLIHTQFPPRTGTRAYQRLLLRALRRRLRRADRRGAPAYVLTDSRHVKVLLQRIWRFPAHRVWNVGAPVSSVFRPPKSDADFERGFEEATKALRPPKRYWLTVGLFKPHKNLGWLLDQLGRYWASGQFSGVDLVMAGTQQPSELLRRLDEDTRLRGRVKVLPPLQQEQLRALYWGAEALLFPSLTEGFGLPVVEAMACGTPVIASRRAPMVETASQVAWWFNPLRKADSRESDELLEALRIVTSPGGKPVNAEGLEPGFPREGEEALEERLRRGIARSREYAPRNFARRVLEIWQVAGGTRRSPLSSPEPDGMS